MATRVQCTSQHRLLVLAFQSDDGLPRIQREILTEIGHRVEALGATRDFAGCIFTGMERAFAVGADIAELARLTPAEAYEFSREGQRVMRLIERSPVPIVAAIRGYCMGGGLDLALACRARIATGDAIVAHPGGALGILTGWGGTQRLSRLIGRSRALEIFTTGKRLTAHEALEAGLVRNVVAPNELMAVAADAIAGFLHVVCP
ncbi:MAG: enoyl-CoA hydratase/isomerase family protein [Candidatus Acidiferrales bacterium]